MTSGGMRAFLRRGKFVPAHSELEDFLSGRISRQDGMAHIRGALLPIVRNPERLRASTLKDLRAWDFVYLDHLAGGRLVPGEPTAAAEPLHGLSSNEALLVRHAGSKRLLKKLPPIIQKSLAARLKQMRAVWTRDAREYDKLYKTVRSSKFKVQSRKKAVQSSKFKVQRRKKTKTEKTGKRKTARR